MIARLLAAIALAALALHGPGVAAADTLRIQVGPHALRVEVAATDAERARGLMYRDRLGRDEGMLFVFDTPAYQSMWMKNTRIPLSVAFVEAGGEILSIHDMEPHTLDSHMSAGPALYAVETNRGWFTERGVRPGDRVTGLPRRPAAGPGK